MKRFSHMMAAGTAGLALGAAAYAQDAPPVPSSVPSSVPFEATSRILSPAEALVQDAIEYGKAHRVGLDEAMRRLKAQEESVAETDGIAARYSSRLAGISIEHEPAYRIVVLLTGDVPVPARTIRAGGMEVPVEFRTGAKATRADIVAVIEEQRSAILAAVPGAAGMGVDTRAGALVLMIRSGKADSGERGRLEQRLERDTGVPIHIRVLDDADENSGVGGGARVSGHALDGRRYTCTTGFVVTDGARSGVMTAAHCPDSLNYDDPDDGGAVALDFVGQWGWRYRDVQIHTTDRALKPLFYADTGKKTQRRVTSWRNRSSTRAGDVVCRRGEATGFSCSEVDLVDYAPPGDLCGGPCAPSWVTVAGPHCKSGDSGGPVFSGTVAFGITKGGNYNRDGRCNFYFYMSTDYLPDGWSLLY